MLFFYEMATFSRKPFRAGNDEFKHPQKALPKVTFVRQTLPGGDVMDTKCFELGFMKLQQNIKNQVIIQHLPRGAVWIQGMVYGHPLSSIQHPLEDPGMLTACVIQDS